jgi:hypothetical protein
MEAFNKTEKTIEKARQLVSGLIRKFDLLYKEALEIAVIDDEAASERLAIELYDCVTAGFLELKVNETSWCKSTV